MRCLIFYILTACTHFSLAQLSAGDIAFVGFDTDSDNLAFIALKDIPANTPIYFSDNEWNELPIGLGGSFGAGEGQIEWSYTSEIKAGEVVELTGLSSPSTISASIGTSTRTSGNFDQANSNETVYAYIGSDDQTPSSFLTAYSNEAFSTSAIGTLVNTGLTAGVNSLSITGDKDLGVYVGSNICNSTVLDCSTLINTSLSWSTDDGTGSQSADGNFPDWVDVQLVFGGTLLPVTWLHFKALPINERLVRLEWATASEINNDHFEIEQSTNGVDFTSVSEVLGNGTSNDLHEYATELAIIAPTCWYRIKQVDSDGQFKYSETIRFDAPDFKLITFPNPCKNHLIVHAPSEEMGIEILSISGEPVFIIHRIECPATLDVSMLPIGHYLLKVQLGSQICYERIVKQ